MTEESRRAIHFIGEAIEVVFSRSPTFSKKPSVPDGFIWGEETHSIVELLSTWFSHERKGRMAKNMGEANLRTARRQGSWGVGRYYFRVRVETGRVFDLYYDRAPKDVDDRGGHWVLWREMEPSGEQANPI